MSTAYSKGCPARELAYRLGALQCSAVSIRKCIMVQYSSRRAARCVSMLCSAERNFAWVCTSQIPLQYKKTTFEISPSKNKQTNKGLRNKICPVIIADPYRKIEITSWKIHACDFYHKSSQQYQKTANE